MDCRERHAKALEDRNYCVQTAQLPLNYDSFAFHQGFENMSMWGKPGSLKGFVVALLYHCGSSVRLVASGSWVINDVFALTWVQGVRKQVLVNFPGSESRVGIAIFSN